MDLFGEKKYEELDLLTKMIEPVTWGALDVFSKLEERVEIPQQYIIDATIKGRGLGFYDIFETFVLNADELQNERVIIDTYHARQWMRDRYQFEIEGDLVIDLRDNTVSGKVFIVKHRPDVSEQELTEILQNSGFRDVYNMGSIDDKPEVLDRMREILDLIGNDISHAALKKRTRNQLQEGLFRSFKHVMRNNAWNIRSIDLANKCASWMTCYIRTGNGAAMRNFCLLKAATHRGYPIYEIEEETV